MRSGSAIGSRKITKGKESSACISRASATFSQKSHRDGWPLASRRDSNLVRVRVGVRFRVRARGRGRARAWARAWARARVRVRVRVGVGVRGRVGVRAWAWARVKG